MALLGTDGLVVLIVLPIRDDMLGLILLLVLVAGLFVIVVRERLLDGVLVLLSEAERLLDRVLVLMELPIRDDMLGLIRLLVLGAVDRELIDRLDVLVLGARLVIALLEMLLLGARLVMVLLELLRLEVLLLGARLVMLRLDVLLLGVRLVVTLLELLLLGVRLAVTRLDVALGAGAGLEACRVCLLELRDLLLLDRVLAAKTGSQNNKRANSMQETRKNEPP